MRSGFGDGRELDRNPDGDREHPETLRSRRLRLARLFRSSRCVPLASLADCSPCSSLDVRNGIARFGKYGYKRIALLISNSNYLAVPLLNTEDVFIIAVD